MIGLRYGTPARDEPAVSDTGLEFGTATRVPCHGWCSCWMRSRRYRSRPDG